MISVSPKALEHVIKLMDESKLSSDSHHLRVGVKGGGCSGLSYLMDFDDKIENTDEVFQVDEKLKVVTELDYSDGLNGKGFQWVNPNASRTCGCGESFAL